VPLKYIFIYKYKSIHIDQVMIGIVNLSGLNMNIGYWNSEWIFVLCTTEICWLPNNKKQLAALLQGLADKKHVTTTPNGSC